MKYSTFALSLLLALLLAVVPLPAQADLVVPPSEPPPTFEEAGELTLDIEVEGVPLTNLATSSLQAGTSYEFAYSIGYETAWFGNGEFTDEERERIFTETLRDYKAYISLWRGVPLTPDVTLVNSWDVSGIRNGTIMATLPGSGPYFFLFDVPDSLYREAERACARNNEPIEFCMPDFTLGMPLEDSWQYIESPSAFLDMGDRGVYEPQGFGGVRFIVEAGTAPTGSSNILFLPGLQGSRLYEKVLGIENRRWELSPGMSQHDARALYLNPDGSSENDIYTKEGEAIARVGIPLAEFDVYRTFFDQLERLKTDGAIADYHIFPYDWRMSPVDVVESGTPYEDGTRFVSEALEELAQTSSTGKVTVVGHSNGGLVAKALMQRLEREGKAHLVDTVMFVSMPQLGTPQTIAPMLHGDFGALTSFGGLYLSKPNARGLAEYMPDAYALLPSPAYFENVSDPVIDLSDAPELAASSGMSEGAVSMYADFERFITGAGGREKPLTTDIETPNTLSPSLLAKAKKLHEKLGAWMPPTDVKVVQIAGWGLDTAKSVAYVEKKETDCVLLVFSCQDVTKLTHRVEMAQDGDGTVMAVSQAPTTGMTTYFINLPTANAELKKNWGHASITESAPFQNLFDLLVNASTTEQLPAYVGTILPETASAEKRLRLRVLSPVTLHAYDSQGRHTGPAENPNPDSDLLYKEEQIPNSYYVEFGEGKYLGLPADGSVRIEMEGLDTGIFTYEVSSVDGERTETVSYENIPVTASSTAVMIIENGVMADAVLEVDINGDGQTDAVAESAGEARSSLTYLRLVKSTLSAMGFDARTERQLIAKFTNIENLLLRNQKWDWDDDDNDHKKVNKKERKEKKVLRKLDKIEVWIERQLLKEETEEFEGKEDEEKSKDKELELTPARAEILLNIISHLRTLVKK